MKIILTLILAVLMVSCIAQNPNQPNQPVASQHEPDSILQEAEQWLGQSAMNTADAINRVINDQGPPDAYIMGEEAGASLGAGVRFGKGIIYFKDGSSDNIFWRGPSLGVDAGISAGRAFVLIYGANNINDLAPRIGGVEGSLYAVGGMSVTYYQGDNVTVVPVRVGGGWRAGVNLGYIQFSAEQSMNPFF
jgi:hypothetical protein